MFNPPLAIVSDFFSLRICKSLYYVKPKTLSERCAPYCAVGHWQHNWQLKSTRCSHTLKGSHEIRDGRILLEHPRDASFKKDLSNEPNFQPDLSRRTAPLNWVVCQTIRTLHRFYSVLSSHHHLFLSTCRFGLKNLHILNGASGSLFWRQLPTVKKLTPSYRLPITRHRSFFFRTRSFKTGLKLINNITLSTPTKFLLRNF